MDAMHSQPHAPARPEPVTVTRADPAAPDLDRDMERLRQLARVMDAKFNIAGVKVGWDSIIGLVPVVGDVATTLIALAPLAVAHRHGLGKVVLARMAANVLVDSAVGSVPLLGDVFDVAFKANLKNLALLEKAVAKHKSRR